MEPMRIISYNCRGLPYNHKDLYKRPTVQMLLNDNDNAIICMQETWFTKQNLANLNTLHPGFLGTGVATFNSQPSWNEHVSGLHKIASNCFIIWHSSGKPRQGEEFESMGLTRSQFKYA